MSDEKNKSKDIQDMSGYCINPKGRKMRVVFTLNKTFLKRILGRETSYYSKKTIYRFADRYLKKDVCPHVLLDSKQTKPLNTVIYDFADAFEKITDYLNQYFLPASNSNNPFILEKHGEDLFNKCDIVIGNVPVAEIDLVNQTVIQIDPISYVKIKRIYKHITQSDKTDKLANVIRECNEVFEKYCELHNKLQIDANDFINSNFSSESNDFIRNAIEEKKKQHSDYLDWLEKQQPGMSKRLYTFALREMESFEERIWRRTFEKYPDIAKPKNSSMCLRLKSLQCREVKVDINEDFVASVSRKFAFNFKIENPHSYYSTSFISNKMSVILTQGRARAVMHSDGSSYSNHIIMSSVNDERFKQIEKLSDYLSRVRLCYHMLNSFVDEWNEANDVFNYEKRIHDILEENEVTINQLLSAEV
jgi:hypothetical protein